MKEELEKLRYELVESYQKERFIIINYPLSSIHIDDMVDTMEEMNNDIPIVIHEDNYYFG